MRKRSSKLLSISIALILVYLSMPLAPAKGQLLNQTLQTVTQLVKVSDDLSNLLAQPSSGKVNLIVQLNGPLNFTLKLLITTLGGEVTENFDSLDVIAVKLPAGSLLQLLNLPGIAYVSPDRQVMMLGHLSSTTGADAARDSSPLNSGLDGSGVGIAVLDSGIYSSHKSFTGRTNTTRVVVSKDFTGEGRTDDPFGHGTHVASIAVGNGTIADEAYLGIAPNANLINLRVLNSNGTGTTSGLLKGLNWVMKNRSLHNIRVVNLSLGAAAVDSYRNDPICKAVRKLVDSGIVVAAAAGNNGVDANGQKVYGQIHSPGIEPSVITVGAANTYGTDSRADDTMTTYSSRGPTRGYWTDAAGLKHYDNLIKPDVVAPGNKIVDAESPGNLLVTQHPELDAGVSSDPTRKMMRLSGTSMATPVVAGTAALMLQANSKLTPNLVKAILMYTSQPLAGSNTFEQGMGQVNIEGAVRLTRLVRTDLQNTYYLGSPLLNGEDPSPSTTIGGTSFTWSRGLLFGYTYGTGLPLITQFQNIYNQGVLMNEGVVVDHGVIAGDGTMMTSGISFGDNVMTSDGVIAGDGTVFCSSGLLLGNGALLSDGQTIGDGVIAGDTRGVIAGDTRGVIAGDSGPTGESSACMPAPRDGGD
jgi:serine protease AprX